MFPFFSYYILPAQTIVKNNVHVGHSKEDIESLLIALSPILYIFHRDIPKPHVLHPNIIRNLEIKPGTLDLLPLFGWFLNEAGEYCFWETEAEENLVQRREAAREFKKFYNELMTVKTKPSSYIEHFLSIRIPVPFSSFSSLEAQKLVKNNVRVSHVKEDIESLLQPLILLFHIAQPETPKPGVLDFCVVEKLSGKNGILDLLRLFGYESSGDQKFVLMNPKSNEDLAKRATLAEEFRRFYRELKKYKDEPIIVFEYFLTHVDSELLSKKYF